MPIDNIATNRFIAHQRSRAARRLYGESALARLLRSSTLTDADEFLDVFSAIQDDLNHVFANAKDNRAAIKFVQQLARLSDTDFTNLASQSFHDDNTQDAEIKRRLTQLRDRMRNNNNATRGLARRLPASADIVPIQQQIQDQVARFCQGVKPALLIANSVTPSKVASLNYLQCCRAKEAVQQLLNTNRELGALTQAAIIDLLQQMGVTVLNPTPPGETDNTYARRVAAVALQQINGRLRALKNPKPNYNYNYLSTTLEDLRANLSQHTNTPREAPLEWTRGITHSTDGPQYDSVRLAVYSGKREIIIIIVWFRVF